MSLSHLDAQGSLRMVDVSAKVKTVRHAVASCRVRLKPETLALLRAGRLAKGDAFAAARLAGILAAKRTAELIPLCHPLALEHVDVRFEQTEEDSLQIEAEARTCAKTGVEMEALAAAAIAALTLYDMAKSSDPAIVVEDLRLLAKTGGKHDFIHPRRRPDGV